jgi:hypothetical protein
MTAIVMIDFLRFMVVPPFTLLVTTEWGSMLRKINDLHVYDMNCTQA